MFVESLAAQNTIDVRRSSLCPTIANETETKKQVSYGEKVYTCLLPSHCQVGDGRFEGLDGRMMTSCRQVPVWQLGRVSV